RAGRAARGVATSPALRRIVETAGSDGEPYLGERALGDQVGVGLGVVEIVPCRHGSGSLFLSCGGGLGGGGCRRRGESLARGISDLVHQPAEIRLFDHVEPAGAVLGGKAEGVERLAD